MPNSKFFRAMSYFLTNNQSDKPPKKKPPAQRSKSKRNRDVLPADHTPQIISKPKRCSLVTTAKPETTKEVVDLTNDEDDLMVPIKIQILDESRNIEPFLIHIKTDPTENSNSFFTNQVSTPNNFIKCEDTTNDITEILSTDDNIIDNSILINDMSIEKQSDPLKIDVPFKQYRNHDYFDLSRDGSKECRYVKEQVDELEIKSVDVIKGSVSPKRKREVKEDTAAVDIPKKVAKKLTKSQKKQAFHLSKGIILEDSGLYYCLLCERSFLNKDTLTSHAQSYNGAKAGYKCSLCDERFEWKGYLARHLKEHFTTSDLEETSESLQQTQNEFGIRTEPTSIFLLDKPTADNHETFNNLEKKLQLNNNSTHASLIKLISDNRGQNLNLACGYCDKCFDSQVSLVEHCRTHTANDGPFICNICGTLFKQNASLVYHTRIHFRMIRSRNKKGVAPFIKYVLKLHSCADCDRSYVSWSALNQHRLNAHSTSVERFLCEICGQVYCSLIQLNRHKKSCKRVGKRLMMHSCEICAKSFRCKSVLAKHKSKKHRSAS